MTETQQIIRLLNNLDIGQNIEIALLFGILLLFSFKAK